MDNFYIIVVVVAVVILILCLVAVGISLQKKGTTDPFPKLQAPCPDGWAVDTAGGCSVNSLNQGGLTAPSYDLTVATDKNAWSGVASTTWTPAPTATICDKRKWAIAKGITWDGVSNYNQCV